MDHEQKSYEHSQNFNFYWPVLMATVVLAMVLIVTQSAIGQEVDISGRWQDKRGVVVFAQRGQSVVGKRNGETIIRGSMGSSGFSGEIRTEFRGSDTDIWIRLCGRYTWVPLHFLLTADGNKIRGTFDAWNNRISGDRRTCKKTHIVVQKFTATRISPPPRSDTTNCTECSNALVATLISKLNYVELEKLRPWLNESRVKYGACIQKIRDGCQSTKEYWMNEYALKGCYETGYVGEPLKQCILRAISQ